MRCRSSTTSMSRQWLLGSSRRKRVCKEYLTTDSRNWKRSCGPNPIFQTRAGKYFDKPAVAVSGSLNYSDLFKVPFGDRAALLDAYNASMFSEFREVNIG